VSHNLSLLLIFLWGVCIAPTELSAQTAAAGGVELRGLTVGFEGSYKLGYWSPIALDLAIPNDSTPRELELVLPDGDGDAVRYVSELKPQPARTVRSVKFGRPNSQLICIVREDGKEVLRRSFRAGQASANAQILFPKAVPADEELIVSLGGDIGVGEVQKKRSRKSENAGPAEHVLLTSTKSLPNDWSAYEGVDLFIYCPDETNTAEHLAREQFQALDQWVQMGGRMLLVVGQYAESLLVEPLSDDRFASWAPGPVSRVGELRRTSGIEIFGDSTTRLDLFAQSRGEQVTVAVLEEAPGRILAAEGGEARKQPTIVESPHGFGSIVFVAFDLHEPLFSAWDGRPQITTKLLYGDRESSNPDDGPSRFRDVSSVSYEDLSGQLRSALDQFSQVRLANFSWVAALIGVYILLIGPVDYFLLRRVFKRMQYTWITFPLVTLTFCVLAVWLSSMWKGRSVWVNQVDVVDMQIDAEGNAQQVRGASWATIYSPAAGPFDLTVEPVESLRLSDEQLLLSWQGLPGEALGGMNVDTLGVSLNDAYRLDRPSAEHRSGRLHGAPIQTSSTRTFITRWNGSSELRMPPKLRAGKRGNRLLGVITNPLNEELHDCVVYYANSAYRFKNSLQSRQTIDLASGAFERTLDWHLTQKSVNLDNKDITTPWNPSDKNVPRILEVMMFHEAAGGRTYTELHNRFQTHIDLTRELTLGKAVFVGRSEQRATTLNRGEKSLSEQYDHQWTFYRFVLPVDKQ